MKSNNKESPYVKWLKKLSINIPKNIWIVRSILPHMDVVGYNYFLTEKDARDFVKNIKNRIIIKVVKYEIKTS